MDLATDGLFAVPCPDMHGKSIAILENWLGQQFADLIVKRGDALRCALIGVHLRPAFVRTGAGTQRSRFP